MKIDIVNYQKAFQYYFRCLLLPILFSRKWYLFWCTLFGEIANGRDVDNSRLDRFDWHL